MPRADRSLSYFKTVTMLTLADLPTQSIPDLCAAMRNDSQGSYMSSTGIQGYRMAVPVMVVEPGDHDPSLKIFDINPSYERTDRRNAVVRIEEPTQTVFNHFVASVMTDLFPGFNYSLPCQSNDFGVQCRVRFDDETMQHEKLHLIIDQKKEIPTVEPIKSVSNLPSVANAKAIVTQLSFWGNTHTKTAGCTPVVQSGCLVQSEARPVVDPSTLGTLDDLTEEFVRNRCDAWDKMGCPKLCKTSCDARARIFVNEGDQVSIKSSDSTVVALGECLDRLVSELTVTPPNSSYVPLVTCNDFGKQLRLKSYGDTVETDGVTDAKVAELAGKQVNLLQDNVLEVRQWERAGTEAESGKHGFTIVLKSLRVDTQVGPLERSATPLSKINDGSLVDCEKFDPMQISLLPKMRDNNSPLLYFTYGESEHNAEFRLVPSDENVEMKNYECPERYRTEGKIPGVYIVPSKASLKEMLTALDEAARNYILQHSERVLGWKLSEAELDLAWNPLLHPDQGTCKIKIPGLSTGVYRASGEAVDAMKIPKQSQANSVVMPYVYFNGDLSGSRKRLIMAGVRLSASVIRLDQQAQHNVYAAGQTIEICPGLTVTVAPPPKRAKIEA